MMLGQPMYGVAAQQQAIPDAPKPQGLTVGPITPGIGSSSSSSDDSSTAKPAGQTPAAAATTPVAQKPTEDQGPPTLELENGEGLKAFTLHVQTNFVEVPFTVKDKKGKLVSGIRPREVRVYEDGVLQHIDTYTADSFPLSVALVIDQSLDFQVMEQVNNSLTAVQGAFSQYDEMAVFTYNNGPRMITDFTAAPSARLTQALERSKSTGREPIMGQYGPIAQTTVINGLNADPNTSAIPNHMGLSINTPREVHTLNDAILEAAKSLQKVKPGRRRIIYVITDGREYGSTAKYAEVRRFLQQNKIAVYGTLVGNSSIPVLGFLDRVHVPMTMRNNVLHNYVNDTGGDYEGEFRQRAIEDSFAKIATELRAQYTLGYYTHHPFIDGKYRDLNVTVLRSDLQVFAKKGYYPTVSDTRPAMIRPAQ